MGNLGSLKKYFVRYKRKLGLGILFILISNSAQVYIPLVLKQGIDSIQNEIDYSAIAQYALLILGASIVAGVFRFLIRETIIVVSREIEFDLRQDFWAHIQRLSLRYFQNNSTGNIMAHATNDISAVRMFVGPAVMYSVDTVTKFVIIIAIIISMSPSLTLYALIPLPFLSYLVYKLSKKIHKLFTKIQEKFSELTTKAQENFAGIRVIKSYVREDSEINSFTKLSREYLDRNMDKVRVQALFMPILFMITGISVIIVIWLGGTMVMENTLTLGELSAFVVYLGMLIWPVIAFGWVINIIQQGDASMKRLNRILHEETDIKDSQRTKYSINSVRGNIEFKDVTFRYKDGLPEVLNKLNFGIPSGSTVAIIGKTGTGKTSLVNLIPRLYDVTEGSVKIDGTDVRDIPLKVLRQSIGLVTQETFLFSDTLTNNILYAAKNASGEMVSKVSDISRLSKDVEDFPKGYDTILGERGITLSGGQKQRTCLARALAIDPKILILDDSFSAVDTNTEEEILRGLKEFMKDRTSIIISHRISTVKDADQILVLDEGIIKEKGTHEELVSLGGIYAELHYKQLLEEELKELN
ncbi:MAG: ABC transporter ATP-binding protein/permease [Melioribacteraceae bacterium]|nr:ABC transporter ATP-binding protein/permease [Melioribacteraceae bacterium]MCF8353699.1 ABC transporter ATP-binding protein/permease [Melioribacteraceae bacterium]MCF8396071.1 ABC transporter ATP-binding protein/permease [Melioribacteraceae bacterium]MCF8418615.1 ABC transporter ATP-binding protein/permease [Melioribacteraceae bacterium]